jgi:Uncharacterized protein conserved in bacteria (DUF2125)
MRRRLAVWVLAGVAALLLIWTAGWFVLRDFVAGNLDDEEAGFRSAGGGLVYASRAFSGYPFAMQVDYSGIVLRLPGGQAVTAPWVRGRARLFGSDETVFELPPEIAIALPQGDGVPPASLRVTSQAMRIKSFRSDERGSEHLLSAARLTIAEATPGPLNGIDVGIENLVAAFRASVEGSVKLMAHADLATLAMTLPTEQAARQLATSLTSPDLETTIAAPVPASLPAIVFGLGEAEFRLRAPSVSQEVIVRQPDRVATMRSDGTGLDAVISFNHGSGRAALDFARFSQHIDPGATGVPVMVFDAAPAAFRVALPLAKQDALSPFRLRLILGGLTANDAAWAIIDKDAVLPRDPGLVDIKLDGEARWNAEPLSLLDAAATRENRPFELPKLAVTALNLKAAGASLSADGAAEMPEGVTLPVGQLDMRLQGGRELLARLRKIGLVTPELAFLVNGYVAIYTRPGDGPDTVTTQIALGPDGLTINGRPYPPPIPPEPAMPEPLTPPAAATPEATPVPEAAPVPPG